MIKEKSWNREIEKSIASKWKRKNTFKFIGTGKVFSIDTPPPYPSGRPWHIGAAAHYSQIDMIARTARMLGFEVFFPIGIDRNGIPVELYTEKKYGINMHKTPREKFIKLCTTALDDLEAEMIEIMKAMGLSGDFDGSEIDKKNVLFSGDTVSASGRLNFINGPGFNLEEWKNSLKRLLDLNIDVMFPGHGTFLVSGVKDHIKLYSDKMNAPWTNIITAIG